MLREIRDTRQVSGELKRRWFSGTFFDLIVWEGPEGSIEAFQLCYDKPLKERALTWKRDGGYIHTAVDDGEGRSGRYKGSPLLVADGIFDAGSVAELFRAQSTGIDRAVSEFVYHRLLAAAD